MTVTHNKTQSRFELETDGLLSVVDYREHGNTLVVTHTYVPPALRGKGVAAVLTKHLLETARREGKKIDPRCSYTAQYIARHREYADLL